MVQQMDPPEMLNERVGFEPGGADVVADSGGDSMVFPEAKKEQASAPLSPMIVKTPIDAVMGNAEYVESEDEEEDEDEQKQQQKRVKETIAEEEDLQVAAEPPAAGGEDEPKSADKQDSSADEAALIDTERSSTEAKVKEEPPEEKGGQRPDPDEVKGATLEWCWAGGESIASILRDDDQHKVDVFVADPDEKETKLEPPSSWPKGLRNPEIQVPTTKKLKDDVTDADKTSTTGEFTESSSEYSPSSSQPGRRRNASVPPERDYPKEGITEAELDKKWDIPITDGQHSHWRSYRVLYHLRDLMYPNWINKTVEEQKVVERALLKTLERRGYRCFTFNSRTERYHIVPRGLVHDPRRDMVRRVFELPSIKTAHTEPKKSSLRHRSFHRNKQSSTAVFRMDVEKDDVHDIDGIMNDKALKSKDEGKRSPKNADMEDVVVFGRDMDDDVEMSLLDEALVGATRGRRSMGKRMKSQIDDPFDIREGKSLTWRNVTMQVRKRGELGKKVLDNVWGEVPKQETTAIMGPSGAGKSSLLNILAGRAKANSKLSISADVRLNNYAVDPSNMHIRKQIAFVAQDDSLHVASTPRECIKFSAKLRLPRTMTDEQLENITTRMLEELGLLKCADTIVGGELLKGISGGERKRTSVGVELVTKPVMVFLDEPTSGLDSFSALQLCNVLKDVANAGASVMFTIHQPASEIFDSFDHLILLNKGRVMYGGPVSAVPEFFGARGQPLPPKYNPADWIMIVAQTLKEEQLELDGFFPEDTRDMKEKAFDLSEGDQGSSLGITLGTVNGNPVSKLTQIGWMARRELKALRRDKRILGARLMLSGFTSTLLGILFWQVGQSSSANRTNLNSHFGASVIILMTAMFGTALPSLVVFPQERPVFLREYSTNHYSAVSYFLSRLTLETILTAIQMSVLTTVTHFMVGFQMAYYWQWIFIFSIAMTSTAISVLLGSAVEDQKFAMELLPMLFVPQFLFSGFFVAPALIPVWIRWVQWLFPLTYSVRLVVLEEFKVCGDELSWAQNNCDTLIEDLMVDQDDTWWLWLGLVSLFVLFRCAAFYILERKANKFF